MYAFVAGASLAGWIMIGHSLLVHFGLTGMPFCVKCTFAAFTVSEVLYLRNAAEALAIARR